MKYLAAGNSMAATYDAVAESTASRVVADSSRAEDVARSAVRQGVARSSACGCVSHSGENIAQSADEMKG